MKTSGLLFLVVLATTLAGCFPTGYSPIQVDSPRLDLHPVCGVDRTGKLSVLPEGESCMFPIRADRELTRTPLKVNPEETYRVTLPRNQVWYDKSRRNVPPNGEKGSWIMNRFAGAKRHSDSQWFALIAVNVNRDNDSITQCTDVSFNSDFKVKHVGQLAFYPNDAIISIPGKFYSNNSGQVWVQIEHCTADCTPPSAVEGACNPPRNH